MLPPFAILFIHSSHFHHTQGKMTVAQGSTTTSAAITAQQAADMVTFEGERARLVSHINIVCPAYGSVCQTSWTCY